MYSKSLVQLALKISPCSQKELASRLQVSPTQVSKWKKGEYMSPEMEERFRELLGIGEKDPDLILLAGSVEDAEKWQKLIRFLAEMAHENNETRYENYLLTDEEESLCADVFTVLKDLGVKPPFTFPEEFVKYLSPNCFGESNDSEEDDELMWGVVEENPLISLIYKIFNASNDVYGFYAAYISDLVYDDDLDIFYSPAQNIEPNLLWLAACKAEVDELLAPAYRKFKYKIEKDYEEWLNDLKIIAFRAGVPLKAELLNMVYHSGDLLGHEAEAESLGFNSTKLHPDVYMNELLTGMRIIHQVLPAIMKKLGIDEEFKLDTSDLHIK